ncbi:peptide deformylase [Citreimonas salinaria]|uniref:Peptide deformylase n=1 Tax=Citreimonas salinaria TaxID=321339 RepID=A0A1H3HKR3_9RHOB|nr:peptide deformylase [Citreimonas salinaria]SDY16087.1 peptide deformylase [Citreimonas salinaria]
MSILPILLWPDPRLSQPCAPVKDDEDLRALIADMFDTMYDAPGRGLAGPQVGALKRVFVMDAGWKDGTPTPRACINPHILSTADTQATGAEGCLSVPGVEARVSRPTSVNIGYADENGQNQRVALTGAEARVALHEMDHLDGRMHFDHLSPQARDGLLSEYESARR